MAQRTAEGGGPQRSVAGRSATLERTVAEAGTGRPRKKSGWLRRSAGPLGGPLVVFAIIIGVWYLVSYEVLSPSRSKFLLPPPQAVVSEAFLDHGNLMILLGALWITVKISLIGLGVAILIGIVLAVIMSEFRAAERGVYPWIVVVQTVPTLALIPLISFWLGFGESARVVVCVLLALFPIVANTFFGLQSPNKPLYDLFDLHHAGRLTKLLKLKIPLALPAVFTGFRISAGLSVIGEIVGGFFFQRGSRDLGVILTQYQYRLVGTMIFGAIILSCLLGIAVFLLFGRIGDSIVGRWKE